MMGLCKASGRLSYPLHIALFPFLYAWMNYVANGSPSQAKLVGIGFALIPLLLFIAWLAYTAWDEPYARGSVR